MTWKSKFPAALEIAVEIFKVVFDNTRDSDIEEGCKGGAADEFVTTTLEGVMNDWAEAIKPADESDKEEVTPQLAANIPAQVPEAEPDLTETISGLGFALKETEDADVLSAYYQKAKSLTRTYIKLLVEESTVQKMANQIMEQSIGTMEGNILQTHTQYFAWMVNNCVLQNCALAFLRFGFFFL